MYHLTNQSYISSLGGGKKIFGRKKKPGKFTKLHSNSGIFSILSIDDLHMKCVKLYTVGQSGVQFVVSYVYTILKILHLVC